jgi:hypothetical protein
MRRIVAIANPGGIGQEFSRIPAGLLRLVNLPVIDKACSSPPNIVSRRAGVELLSTANAAGIEWRLQ